MMFIALMILAWCVVLTITIFKVENEKERWKRQTIRLVNEVSRLRIELNKRDIENEIVL